MLSVFGTLIPTCFARLAVLAILGITAWTANATDMNPRSYSNIPTRLNFLIAGYANVRGNVAFARPSQSKMPS
jgi:hypothetical protein